MDPQQYRAEYINTLRRTLEAILRGLVYRNAGEMPHYEEPIGNLMTTLGWDNIAPEQIEWYIQLILAIFDGRDYPERGTLPAIETPIHQTIIVLMEAINNNVNRIRALYQHN
jgi:hypothetical protein